MTDLPRRHQRARGPEGVRHGRLPRRRAGIAVLKILAGALVVAVVSFIVGIAQAVSGHAAATLPFWLATMGSAVVAGVLVYLASRRGKLR